jgi:cell wall-associated NlpC family hydrolase
MGLVRLAQVLIVSALATACASSGAVPRPFPGTPDSPPAAGKPTAPRGAAADPARVVETALSYRGAPYRNGGSDPKGFDCSGLVQYVFAQQGVTIPREVREQVRLGREVRLAGVERGDLIFFAVASTEPSHVGIATGGDAFVHAPSARGVVRVEKFSDPYWARRVVAVRRLH